MRNVFDRHITCAFLYSITRYGYPPDAEHMVTYVHEMADLGFQSIELEGIGEAHLKTVYKHRKEIKQALEDRGLALPVFCTVLPGIASPQGEIAQKSLDLFKTGCELGAYFGAGGYWITALLFLMNFRQICLFTGIIHRTYFVMCVCRKDCRGKYIGTICCLGWIQLANLRQIMG